MGLSGPIIFAYNWYTSIGRPWAITHESRLFSVAILIKCVGLPDSVEDMSVQLFGALMPLANHRPTLFHQIAIF